ncbi:hypothetical protein [Phaeovulum sp.]|uniref:hypothetical protein n=1 Tax=Phaeovulum sp. TaxID=2934796 RepID=UPI003566D1B3
MKHLALATSILLAGATSAQAQSGGVYTSGLIEYSYNATSDISIAYADFSLGFEFGSDDLPMGFDLGILGFANDGGGSISSYSSLYPTFWVDTSIGRFSIGVPRSALGSKIDLPAIGSTTMLDLMYGYFIKLTDYLPLVTDVDSYGARFDGAFGGFEAGISVHDLSNAVGSATTVTGYISRDFGAFDFTLGFEDVDQSPISQRSYFAQIGYDVGTYGGHLTVIDPSVLTAPGVMVMLDGFYKPNDWLKLSAAYASQEGASDLYSVNAEASFLKNGYAGIGLWEASGGTGSNTTLYVGWKLDY